MKKFNWTNIKLAFMFALVIFLYSFTSKRNEQRKLKKSVVEFVNENSPFITQEAVNKLLIENNAAATSIQKDELDLNKLEKTLNNHNMIEKCEVFVSVDGVLKAVVKQKTPVARVFEDNGSFYIDYEGHKMPLSDNFTARVPIVSGGINGKNNENLNEVFRYIYDDEFLHKNIIGIQVLPNGSLKMMNRNFNYVIDFGRTINVDKKFKNYKAFFQKAIRDSLINKYKTVNLKFTQQVVCTKN
ncbi:cell division protein FtsQ [Flavobacterium sp. WW92]|uniref:cell division protein FtsQ/DivIB n=1 Tax=unclassified Flavobacterium TaxID=196869 RepID=UPI0022253604|nr:MULTISPECIES: cell division protein FtsQ [unclassified Flavobacterium]WDO13270.1 cell division protein FtsQ [Flavobacterium sp. WW92]